MNLKRLSAAALALTLTASFPAAFADDVPALMEGGDIMVDVADFAIPDDTSMLLTPLPGNEEDAVVTTTEMPHVDVPAPNGGYKTVISVNGKQVESFDFEREIPGWGSQMVTWRVDELDAVPTGYVPMRAITQADGGSCFWDGEANEAWFFLGDYQLIVSFADMTVKANDQSIEGVTPLLLNGVTYLPFSVIDSLEGFSVTDNSADGTESYNVTTPNGTPLMLLAGDLLETAGMGRGMKATPAELEEIYGEAHGFKAEYMTEGVAFLPMMTSPDTLVLGKAAADKLGALEESFEAYRKSQEQTFSWYLSQNLPKVENAKFVTEGDWFMFLIGENADAAVELFHARAAELK